MKCHPKPILSRLVEKLREFKSALRVAAFLFIFVGTVILLIYIPFWLIMLAVAIVLIIGGIYIIKNI